jgi:cyclopropane fatty-acyl-phospholipid synthase-like methyltransferase
MSSMAKIVMGRFYREAAGDPSRLPWHREAPEALLVAAVEKLGPGRRALDLGCGAGVFSVWMAQRGLRVTALDLFPEAIAMASARANAQGVTLELITGDLVDYRAPEPFDLVFDSGCLHSLVDASVDTYKRKLMQWLTPSGEFVLEHWGKRHMLDWRPIGPRRRSQATLERIFAPELSLLTTKVDDFAAPLPFGPTVRGVAYHFRRSK